MMDFSAPNCKLLNDIIYNVKSAMANPNRFEGQTFEKLSR